MDMPMASRAAVLNRLRAVIELAADRPAPREWGDLSVTEQMLVGERDPELSAVMRNQMGADLEIAVMSGKLPAQAPEVMTEEQQRAQAVQQWCDEHPVVDPVEAARAIERQIAERNAQAAASAQLSVELANRALKAQGAAGRGW